MTGYMAQLQGTHRQTRTVQDSLNRGSRERYELKNEKSPLILVTWIPIIEASNVDVTYHRL